MAKIAEDAAAELPLNDERVETPKKLNRHVVIAQNHMKKRRAALDEQIAALTAERDGLDAAILALG